MTCLVCFFFFSALAALSSGLTTGLCKVPSVATGAGAGVPVSVGTATGTATTTAVGSVCLASTTRGLLRSFFSFISATCRAINSACFFASPARNSFCAASTTDTGANGIGGAACTGTAGSMASLLSAVTPSTRSRFTKTRFLRTSTWIVRALPVLSDFLISVVCRRVRVILPLSSVAPWTLRR